MNETVPSPTTEIQDSRFKIQNKPQETDQKSQRKVYNLRERLLIFSKRMLQICKKLPRIPEFDGIRKQLANAGTSIGANYEEADGTVTKKDFINKVAIARKEAKETRYWLKIISGTCLEDDSLLADINESEQIISILSAILINCGASFKR